MTTTSFGYHVRENKKNSKFKHNNNGTFNVKSQFPPHVTIQRFAATIFGKIVL